MASQESSRLSVPVANSCLALNKDSSLNEPREHRNTPRSDALGIRPPMRSYGGLPGHGPNCVRRVACITADANPDRDPILAGVVVALHSTHCDSAKRRNSQQLTGRLAGYQFGTIKRFGCADSISSGFARRRMTDLLSRHQAPSARWLRPPRVADYPRPGAESRPPSPANRSSASTLALATSQLIPVVPASGRKRRKSRQDTISHEGARASSGCRPPPPARAGPAAGRLVASVLGLPLGFSPARRARGPRRRAEGSEGRI